MALTWGYGHLFIYLAGVAVAAGFAVLVDIFSGHSQTPLLIGHYAVDIPVAIYLLALWFVRDSLVLTNGPKAILPVFAVLILVATPLLGLEGVALLTVLCVALRIQWVGKTQEDSPDNHH